MAEFRCGSRDAGSWFLAFEADAEDLAWLELVDGQAGVDEGHGAEASGNIDLMIETRDLGDGVRRHRLTGLYSCCPGIAERAYPDVYVC